MLAWIADNIASIVLLLAVVAMVFFLVRSKIKERKQGSCVCGCGCSGCSSYAGHKKGGKI